MRATAAAGRHLWLLSAAELVCCSELPSLRGTSDPRERLPAAQALLFGVNFSLSLSLSRVFIQTARVLCLYITQASGIGSRLLQLAAINMHIYSVKIRSYVLSFLNSCLNAILLYEHGHCEKIAFEFAPCWRAHQCRETCVSPLSAPTE